MRVSSIVVALTLGTSALAQDPVLMTGNAIWHDVGMSFETILYPTKPPMAGGFVGGNITDNAAIHRYIFYNAERTYFGYDLIGEPVPNSEFYKLTFRPMTIVDPKRLEIPNPDGWKLVPLSGYPAPQMLRAGDTVELELFKNAATGQKIIEHIRVQNPKGSKNAYILGTEDVLYINLIHQPDASGVFVIRPDGTIPMQRFGGPLKAAGLTVDELSTALEERYSQYFNHPKANVRIMRINGRNAPGVARDVSVEDVELRIIAPQVYLNGKHVYLQTYEDGVVGPAVWFYLPDHGRYVLSLVPHPQTGFVKAGEVRGSSLNFTVGGETLGLTSGVEIAPGYAPYNLYVLHERNWKPEVQALAGTFVMGSAERLDLVLSSRPKQIGVNDVLWVDILHQPGGSAHATVRPDGFITLPIAGEVKAAGLTPQQLQESVLERLSKTMPHPEVVVQVLRVNNPKFYVSGNVKKPGVYPLTTPLTVLEAIRQAGGPADFAHAESIFILRGQTKLRFNYAEVSQGKHLEQNVQLKNGDYVNVP